MLNFTGKNKTGAKKRPAAATTEPAAKKRPAAAPKELSTVAGPVYLTDTIQGLKDGCPGTKVGPILYWRVFSIYTSSSGCWRVKKTGVRVDRTVARMCLNKSAPLQSKDVRLRLCLNRFPAMPKTHQHGFRCRPILYLCLPGTLR